MGIRTAIGKKAFLHMQKRDMRRRIEEKGNRQELRDYYGNQDQEDVHAQGNLKAALDQSRSREQGSGFRARIKRRMQKWSGIESDSNRERQTMQNLYQEVAHGGGEGKDRGTRRDEYDQFREDSQANIDDSLDDKNHNIALPKWTVDVDQNNRLAQFEDLIGGQHRQKKAVRHDPADQEAAPALLSDMVPMTEFGESALEPEPETAEPTRRKKRRMDEIQLEDEPAAPQMEDEPAALQLEDEPAAPQLEVPAAPARQWTRKPRTPLSAEPAPEELLDSTVRRKKRRAPGDN